MGQSWERRNGSLLRFLQRTPCNKILSGVDHNKLKMYTLNSKATTKITLYSAAGKEPTKEKWWNYKEYFIQKKKERRGKKEERRDDITGQQQDGRRKPKFQPKMWEKEWESLPKSDIQFWQELSIKQTASFPKEYIWGVCQGGPKF